VWQRLLTTLTVPFLRRDILAVMDKEFSEEEVRA